MEHGGAALRLRRGNDPGDPRQRLAEIPAIPLCDLGVLVEPAKLASRECRRQLVRPVVPAHREDGVGAEVPTAEIGTGSAVLAVRADAPRPTRDLGVVGHDEAAFDAG